MFNKETAHGEHLTAPNGDTLVFLDSVRMATGDVRASYQRRRGGAFVGLETRTIRRGVWDAP